MMLKLIEHDCFVGSFTKKNIVTNEGLKAKLKKNVDPEFSLSTIYIITRRSEKKTADLSIVNLSASSKCLKKSKKKVLRQHITFSETNSLLNPSVFCP